MAGAFYFNAGDGIGDYEIVKTLGNTHCGEVYLVKHTPSQQLNVLRVIQSEELLTETEIGQQFRQEFEKAHAVQHPNVAGVMSRYKYNELKMTFVLYENTEGIPLSGFMKTRAGEITVSRVLGWAGEMASALDGIAAAGLIHQNIRPTNIILQEDGHLKLTDLGLSCFRKASLQNLQEDLKKESSVSLDTLAYCAPEQVQNASADIRTDIYSLGMVLYFLLSGQLPFHSTSGVFLTGEIMYAERPALSSLGKDIPEPLSLLVARMTAKNPAERPQTPEQLKTELVQLQQQLSKKQIPVQQVPAESPAAGRKKLALKLVGQPEQSSGEEAASPGMAPAKKEVSAAEDSAGQVQKQPEQKPVDTVPPKQAVDLQIPPLEKSGEQDEIIINEIEEKKHRKVPFSWKMLPSMISFIFTKLADMVKTTGRELYVIVIPLAILGGAAAVGLSMDIAVMIGDESAGNRMSAFHIAQELQQQTDVKRRQAYVKMLAEEGQWRSLCYELKNGRGKECIEKLRKKKDPDLLLIAATIKMLGLDVTGKDPRRRSRIGREGDFLPLMEEAAKLGSLEAAGFLRTWHENGGDRKKAEEYDRLCRQIMQRETIPAEGI